MQIIETISEQETFEYGKRLGQAAKAGSVYALMGDLGTGKTVIAKGMAAGLGIEEPVVSPTFMIVREYRGEYRPSDDIYGDVNRSTLPFFHFDIYRLEDEDELFEIGWEDYLSQEGVCLVEWADLIREAMPANAVWIGVEKDLSKGPEYRRILQGSAGEIFGTEDKK